jgi:hypothetical protein
VTVADCYFSPEKVTIHKYICTIHPSMMHMTVVVKK